MAYVVALERVWLLESSEAGLVGVVESGLVRVIELGSDIVVLLDTVGRDGGW